MRAFFDPGVLRLNWSELRARRALPCIVSIVAILAARIMFGRPDAGMVAAAGAMSVGFGSFQWLGRSRVRPMLWAALGMGVSALGGSLVGHNGAGTVVNGAVAGFGGGMLPARGPGSSWIGQQCAIVAPSPAVTWAVLPLTRHPRGRDKGEDRRKDGSSSVSC